MNADRYASGLIEETDLTISAHFEIRGFDTKSRNPSSISFAETDLIWEDVN